jgi:hypothetical protein
MLLICDVLRECHIDAILNGWEHLLPDTGGGFERLLPGVS